MNTPMADAMRSGFISWLAMLLKTALETEWKRVGPEMECRHAHVDTPYHRFLNEIVVLIITFF